MRATAEGQKRLKEAKAAKQNFEGGRYTNKDIAGDAYCTEKTVQRFFKGEDVSYEIASSICRSLDLDVAEILENPTEVANATLDWHRVCADMFKFQKERFDTRRGLLEQNRQQELSVFIPLGLVKPKLVKKKIHDQKRNGLDADLDVGRQYEVIEEQIEKKFEYEDFLSEVIFQSSRSLVIAGEPGAGKSTWLENIAQILIEANSAKKFLPIFISLSFLREKTLGDYLTQVWLPEALSIQNFVCTEAIIQEFKALFVGTNSSICLLLDGLDEMSGESPAVALSAQLQGWLGTVQVYLSCRLNVWEVVGKQAFPNFDVYRTLGFSPEQIEEFIGQWYRDDEAKGRSLLYRLQDNHYRRLMDLVKNPLRLVMLCAVYQEEDYFPESQADLSERFVRLVYLWKSQAFPISETQKQEIHQALGKIAIQMFEENQVLTEDFINQFLTSEQSTLIKRLGWINQVDTYQYQPVYAFYHLTFAEYFAALAIDDWDFFIPRNHINNPVRNKKYRIFEKRYENIFLLWLGRRDICNESKDALLLKFSDFDAGLEGGFYEAQLLLKSLLGLNEYTKCSYIDQIIKKIVFLECRNRSRLSKNKIFLDLDINLLKNLNYHCFISFTDALFDAYEKSLKSGGFSKSKIISLMCDLISQEDERVIKFIYSLLEQEFSEVKDGKEIENLQLLISTLAYFLAEEEAKKIQNLLSLQVLQILNRSIDYHDVVYIKEVIENIIYPSNDANENSSLKYDSTNSTDVEIDFGEVFDLSDVHDLTDENRDFADFDELSELWDCLEENDDTYQHLEDEGYKTKEIRIEEKIAEAKKNILETYTQIKIIQEKINQRQGENTNLEILESISNLRFEHSVFVDDFIESYDIASEYNFRFKDLKVMIVQLIQADKRIGKKILNDIIFFVSHRIEKYRRERNTILIDPQSFLREVDIFQLYGTPLIDNPMKHSPPKPNMTKEKILELNNKYFNPLPKAKVIRILNFYLFAESLVEADYKTENLLEIISDFLTFLDEEKMQCLQRDIEHYTKIQDEELSSLIRHLEKDIEHTTTDIIDISILLARLDPNNEQVFLNVIKNFMNYKGRQYSSRPPLNCLYPIAKSNEVIKDILQTRLRFQTFVFNCYPFFVDILEDKVSSDFFNEIQYLLKQSTDYLSYEEFYRIAYSSHSLHPELYDYVNLNKEKILLSTLPDYIKVGDFYKIYWLDYTKVIDDPVIDYYEQLLDQDFPSLDAEPENFSQLRSRWNNIQRHKEKKDFLILYSSQPTQQNYGCDPEHLKHFSQFKGYVAAITTTEIESLQTFDPEDLDLLDNLQKWINRTQSEQ